MADDQAGNQLLQPGRKIGNEQLSVGQAAAVPSQQALRLEPPGGQPAAGPAGELLQFAVKDAAVGRRGVWQQAAARLPDQPAAQPPAAPSTRERMPLGQPLEECQAEQIALPLVDSGGEVVVE